MTPEQMAEAFERARYEQLRTASWTDLREGERAARIDVARQAFESAGITARLQALEAIAEEAELQAGVLAQRDAEIARRRAEHEQELSATHAEHERAVQEIQRRCDVLTAERDEAADRALVAEARAALAEATIAAVHAALSGGAAGVGEPTGADPADPTVVPQQATAADGVDDEPTHRPDRPVGGGGRRLPRLVRAGTVRG